ncbi:MAG: hypothetical protein RET84_18235 [Pseudomonadota bacterium]|nr:hypothetical protein [Pseudomonadota bacterium]MDQ7999792.1 hypothetical protein [Pseudomonadota bacterium]
MTGGSTVQRRRRPWRQSLTTLIVAALIGWGCLIGASELLDGLRTGVLDNRKGPDVVAADRPLLYWALFGFYTVATLTAACVALFLSVIAVRDLVRRTGPGR